MFIKRVVILNGDIIGSLKAESIKDNCSCMITLMSLNAPCRAVIKVGTSPLVVEPIDNLKTTIRINCTLGADVAIACIIVGKQNDVRARGKTANAAAFSSIMAEYDEYCKTVGSSDKIVAISSSVQQQSAGLAVKIAEVIGVSRGESQIHATANTMNIQETAEMCEVVSGSPCAQCNIASAAVLQSADGGEEPFYIKVGDRLQELFTQYPHDTELEQLVYSSRWVRVEYDEANYYVVGVIEEETHPLFICYGVPVDAKSAHQSDNAHCEWLPTNRDDMDGKGYWVLYQDARTGETLT